MWYIEEVQSIMSTGISFQLGTVFDVSNNASAESSNSSSPTFGLRRSKKRAEKVDREKDLEPLRKHFDVNDHWAPVFSPNLVLVGDVLVYDTKSKRLRKVGCLEGLYRKAAASKASPGLQTPYQKLLRKNKLERSQDIVEKPYYDKTSTESKEKLKTIVGLHSEIGHFAGIDSLSGPSAIRQYYEVNELNRCHVYLKHLETAKRTLSFDAAKVPSLNKREVLVVVTGACYHEGGIAVEQSDDTVTASISASASASAEQIPELTSKESYTRQIFPSFVELKRIDYPKLDRGILSRLGFSRTVKSVKFSDSTRTEEPVEAVQSTTKESKTLAALYDSLSDLELHISLAFLAYSMFCWSESVMDKKEGLPGIATIFNDQMRMLPAHLKKMHQMCPHLQEEDIKKTYKKYFEETERDPILFKWEWKYNFSQGKGSRLSQELKQINFRPSALGLDKVTTLAHATYFAKNTQLELLVKQLINFTKLNVLDDAEATQVFVVIAQLSCSSSQVVDRYDNKAANEILMVFARAKLLGLSRFQSVLSQAQSSSETTLASLVKSVAKDHSTHGDNTQSQVGTLGQIFVFALDSSFTSKILAFNIIKSCENCTFTERESVLLFNMILPWIETQTQDRSEAPRLNSAIQQLLNKASASKSTESGSLAEKLEARNSEKLSYEQLLNLVA